MKLTQIGQKAKFQILIGAEEVCHAKFTLRISLCIRKENKQIYNESHRIYDFGSQGILYLCNVDNFYIFHASLSCPHYSQDFWISF